MNRNPKLQLVAKLKNSRRRHRFGIHQAEWDFSAVEQADLLACVEWEFPRSVPAFREGVRRLRERSEPDFRSDPALEMFDYLSFEEWPEVRFTELPPERRHLFRLDRLDDEGMPRDLATSLEMEEDGTSVLLRQLEVILAHAEKYGAAEALKVATEYWQDPRRATSDTTHGCMTLNLDLRRSDDFLVAGFRKLIESRRRERRLQVTELRGASNALSQARAALKHLAAARLIRAMPWEDAYTETLEACGREFYANRQEVWRRAASKGESLIEIWKQKVMNF